MIDLTYANLQAIKWACLVGVPSFFMGWFAHGLLDWLMAPPGPSQKDRR
jgi:hypothetical protein